MGSVCGQWVYLSGVIHDSRPSLLTAFLCHFSPSLFLSLYPDSRTFWACLDTEHQHFRCSLWSRGQPAPTDPAVLACLISLCVCVCVFKCVSLTICFSLPLVLLLAFHFKRNWFSFIAFFVCDPFDVCVCLHNSVSAQGFILLRTQIAEISAVFAYVCVVRVSAHLHVVPVNLLHGMHRQHLSIYLFICLFIYLFIYVYILYFFYCKYSIIYFFL